MAAAEEAADNLMQELKAKLLGLPKKVCLLLTAEH